MAWVCDAGKTPCDNEALTIWVKYGSNKSINSRTRNVEVGSSEHDFTGDDMKQRRTSICEHSRKDGSEVSVLPDPENMGIAVGILLLSCLEAEICVFSYVLPVNGHHL